MEWEVLESTLNRNSKTKRGKGRNVKLCPNSNFTVHFVLRGNEEKKVQRGGNCRSDAPVKDKTAKGKLSSSW
jgi:hypothetical protein